MEILLMIYTLDDLVHVYMYMYFSGRIPFILVYEVYTRSCRFSTINSIMGSTAKLVESLGMRQSISGCWDVHVWYQDEEG